MDGTRLGTTQLPPGAPPALSRGGDGRIYVDDADGASTHVVGPGGVVTSVATGGALPETVTVAAPPARRSPVTPPPARIPGEVPGVSGPQLPVQPGPGLVDPGFRVGPPIPPNMPIPPIPPNLQIPPNPTIVLLPPTGVTAKAGAGGVVTVGWPAVATATSYVVRGGGQTQETASTTVTFTGLPVGRPVTFTVQAAAGAARSVESRPSNPATPFGTPGAPTFFGAGPDCQVDCSTAYLQWQEPELAGGRLVHYVVTGAQDGRQMRTQTVVTRTARYDYGDDYTECGVIVFGVQAVTTSPGSGVEESGPEAVFVFGGYTDAECTPTASVGGATVNGLSVGVTVLEGASGEGTCTIELNGVGRDTQACGRDPLLPGFAETAEVRDYDATIDGLEPDTTYSITVTASNENGSTTSDAVVVTTGPAA